MWIDHVEQGYDDQEDWNIDNFGRTAKGKGKNIIHQVEEDDQERHVQFEEETYM